MTTHLFLAALGAFAVLSGTALAYRIEAAVRDVSGLEREPVAPLSLPEFTAPEVRSPPPALIPVGESVFGCGWIQRWHCQRCDRCGHWVLRIVYAEGAHEDWDPSRVQARYARSYLRTAEWTRWLPFVPSDRGGFHACRPVVPSCDVLVWKRKSDEDCRGKND